MAKKILKGIPVSFGISIGKAYLLSRDHYCLAPIQNISDEFVEEELSRLREAFDKTLEELKKIRESIPEEHREYASLIDSHIVLLQDPKLREAAEHYIKDMKLNAEWALEKGMSKIENYFTFIDNEYLRSTVQELRLLTKRVMAHLLGNPDIGKPITSRVILVAYNLSPADTIGLDVSKIMALVISQGGKTSHVSIIARTMEIPAVVGVEGVERYIEDGQLIVVDAINGKIVIEPDDKELEYYLDLKYRFETYKKELMKTRELPAITKDGFTVNIMANIELLEEVRAVKDYAAEGIGLYRTEYSYIYRSTPPSEEELYEEYRDLALLVHPQQVIIRTLDLGGDKLNYSGEHIEEANPALGLRAIRFCMKYMDIFKTQLRAILRASEAGNISLMFPMISGLDELRAAKKVLEEVKEELREKKIKFNEDIPLGIMIELPSAVMIADILAKEVDFFSIGTNDLIQYSLGIDRTNKYVSHLYQPLHPAIIRSLKQVVSAAHKNNIKVSVCGEMAVEPFCLPVLLGLKIDSLSVSPQVIPMVKRILRKLTVKECVEILDRLMDSTSVSQSNQIVLNYILNKAKEEVTFYSSLILREEEEE